MGKIINNNKLIPYTDAQAEAGILRDSINHPSMFCQNVELKLERDQFGIKGRCPRLTIEPLEKSYEKSSVNEFVADSKRQD